MDDEPLILGFEAPLAELARSLQRFEKNYQKLGALNDHCVSFNETFGQIFNALQLTSSCYDYGEVCSHGFDAPRLNRERLCIPMST